MAVFKSVSAFQEELLRTFLSHRSTKFSSLMTPVSNPIKELQILKEDAGVNPTSTRLSL